MDFVRMLEDAYAYTYQALIGKWERWLILSVVSLIPIVNLILSGYIARVYRGASVAPEIGDDYVTLWVDGLKLAIVGFVYLVPLFIVQILFGMFSSVFTAGAYRYGAFPMVALGTILLGGLLMFSVALVIGLVQQMALVRFARTDDFGEAFNISAILDHIGRIGWPSYVVAMIVLYLALAAFALVFFLFTIITLGLGMLLLLVVVPPIAIFMARYVTMIYDSTDTFE